MSKKEKDLEKQKKNELKFYQYIEPMIENIIQDILTSRISNNMEKDTLQVQYKTNNNKYVDLTQFQNENQENPHIYELNIYILFKRQYISFIVEHWKLKIDSTQSQFNELTTIFKNRIKKKLITFYRSIKTIQKILPLNSLVNKTFDYSFSANLFLQSNIEINLEDKIKNEKKQIIFEAKDEKYGSIQLSINYLTKNGIFAHENNIKNITDYNKLYTQFYTKLSLEKAAKSKMPIAQQNFESTNLDLLNNDDEGEKKNNNIKAEAENNINDSAMFDKFEKNELMFSNVIQSKMIDKNGNLEQSDFDEIKEFGKGNSKEQFNADELYSSCFENIKDINCQKTIEEILDKNNLMNKENQQLNEIKDKYELYFGKNNNLIVEELYEEMKNFEFINLLIDYPKIEREEKNNIISDYFDEKPVNKKNDDKESENDLVNGIISDYIEIKQLLKSK